MLIPFSRGRNVQYNFNGSNTFRTMKISSKQGLFEPMRFDDSTRLGGIIGITFPGFIQKGKNKIP